MGDSAIYFRLNYLMNLLSHNLKITSNPVVDFRSQATSKNSNIDDVDFGFLNRKNFLGIKNKTGKNISENGEKIIQYRDSR